MKLLTLRFKNLNSFVGEWSIDFTAPDYEANGIFAIVGPTGSGKTTLLDAICLALYRRTPRLGDITGSSNEIMSRQTGECSVEVEFKTVSGHYRCTFQQHRAGRNPQGTLQGYTHELVDVATGHAVLQRGATASGIEAYTGMDFSRFTRSIMLAQGSFDAFLKAKPDERSPILEQITGTTIYAQISLHVHQLKTDQDRKLTDLQKDRDRVALLAPEDEKQLKVEFGEVKERETVMAGNVKSMAEQCEWLKNLQLLKAKLAQTNSELNKFSKSKNEFSAKKYRLENAEKALAVAPEYSALTSARQLVDSFTAERVTQEKALPELKKAQTDAEAKLQQAINDLKIAKKEQTATLGVLKHVRELDGSIRNHSAQADELNTKIQDAQQKLDGYQSEKNDIETRILKIHDQLNAVTHYIAENSDDKILMKEFSAVRRDFDQLKLLTNKLAQEMDYLGKAHARKASAQSELEGMDVAVEDIETRKSAAEATITALSNEIADLLKGRQTSDMRNEQERLNARSASVKAAIELLKRAEKAESEHKTIEQKHKDLTAAATANVKKKKHLEERQAMLEAAVATSTRDISTAKETEALGDKRQELEDGKPCPLCGALEHPYSSGHPPEKNSLQQQLEEAQQQLADCSKERHDVDVAQAACQTEQAQLEKQAADLTEELATNKGARQAIFNSLKLACQAGSETEKAAEELKRLAETINALKETLSALYKKERGLTEAQQALQTVNDEFNQIGQARQEAQKQLAKANADVARFKAQSDETKATLDRVQTSAHKLVSPYGFTDVALSTVDHIQRDLTARLKTWQAKNREHDDLVTRKQTNDAELQKVRALHGTLSKTLDNDRSKLVTLQDERDKLSGKRKELFGDKIADDEETRLNTAISHLEKALETIRQQHEAASSALNENKAAITSIAGQLADAEKQVTAADACFKEKLATKFVDEAAYQEACLPEDERAALRHKADELNNKGIQLQAVHEEQTKNLSTEKDRALTNQSIEDLQTALQAVETEHSSFKDRLAEIKAKLTQNETNRKSQATVFEQIEKQQKECQSWARLHALIGSSDGKKYRNFAQGLTFEIMINHANRQLRKMTDRYLLIKNEDNPLELDVIDNYQGGEVRTTKNLSGGESFIVSLALALGLSNMSSRNIRVDTMFLDEGFGTLDEDALETALETLAELQEDGKLIGVISHVPALKERITTQIQVITGAGGRSQLQGPGCTKL